jgi:hypothetical protein
MSPPTIIKYRDQQAAVIVIDGIQKRRRSRPQILSATGYETAMICLVKAALSLDSRVVDMATAMSYHLHTKVTHFEHLEKFIVPALYTRKTAVSDT